MSNSPARAYLEHKVLTATPEELQLMLYDAAIRAASRCRQGHVDRDFEKAQDAFETFDAILCELHAGLRPEVDASLVEKYAALYTFCQRRMDDGHGKGNLMPIDEAIGIVEHLRQTWRMLMDKIATQQTEETQELQSLALET